MPELIYLVPCTDNVTISIWTVIEANVGIICACLPALSKPLAKMFPGLKGFFHGHPSTHDGSKYPSAANDYGSNAYGKGNLASSNETSKSEDWVQLGPKGGNRRKMSMGVARDSDEESLYGRGHGKEESEVGTTEMGGITKTMEFSLERDDGDSSSSGGKHVHTPCAGEHRGHVSARGDQMV